MPADVYFTTNPAEFTRLEGLYVTERDPPGFIRGRDLSITGMFGRTVRGPTTPQVITSTGRFVEVYGGRDQGGVGQPATNEIWKALVNKPFGTLVIRRVVAQGTTSATLASVTLDNAADGTGTNILRVDATSLGAWGNGVGFKIEDASDGDVNKFNLVVRYLGSETRYENLDTRAGTDNLLAVIGDDVANFLTVTKLADGRPINSAAITEVTYVAARDTDDFVTLGESSLAATYSQVSGSEGVLEATDYIAALTDVASVQGPGVVLCPESLEDTVGATSQATLNAAIVTQAATVHDRIFLTWSGICGLTPAQEISALTAQITTRSDRIVWAYNCPRTLDPSTATKFATGPHIWMASIFSQNDVDVHPGAQEAGAQTAGIAELATETLTRGDLIALRDAGISTLEKLPGQFLFRSGVTTSLITGRTEVTRRRMADFLQLSAADRLRFFVKAKNTLELRAQIVGELTAFSQSLRDQGRVVEEFELEQESVNTPAQRAQGVEKLLWRVRLLGHILHLVLETEIGTGVVIEAE